MLRSHCDGGSTLVAIAFVVGHATLSDFSWAASAQYWVLHILYNSPVSDQQLYVSMARSLPSSSKASWVFRHRLPSINLPANRLESDNSDRCHRKPTSNWLLDPQSGVVEALSPQHDSCNHLSASPSGIDHFNPRIKCGFGPLVRHCHSGQVPGIDFASANFANLGSDLNVKTNLTYFIFENSTLLFQPVGDQYNFYCGPLPEVQEFLQELPYKAPSCQ
jgi:hypothetical protein